MATAKMFGQFLKTCLNKEVDIDTDTIKVALYTGTLPGTAQDSWVYKADIATIVEASGTGYSTGGAQITPITMTYAGGADPNVITVDGPDITWSNSTITAALAIIYDDTPATNKPLIGYVDFAGSKSSSTGNFTITWDAAGIFTITTAA